MVDVKVKMEAGTGRDKDKDNEVDADKKSGYKTMYPVLHAVEHWETIKSEN